MTCHIEQSCARLLYQPPPATLALAACACGHQGIAQLSAALRNHTGLTSLGLEHNSIGCAGATVLVASLAANTALLKLDLSSNRLGNDGADVIGRMLVTSSGSNLRRLNLRDNNIGVSDGEVVLHDVLEKAGLTGAEACSDCRSNLYRHGVELLALALRKHESTLQFLGLGDNIIGNSTALSYLLPNMAIPYHTIPYHTIPYHTMVPTACLLVRTSHTLRCTCRVATTHRFRPQLIAQPCKTKYK